MPSDHLLTRTAAVIEGGISAGLHVGAQLYVSLKGQPVADLAFGASRPGVLMTPDSIVLWLSCTKPLAAVAIARLWEAGKLALDDRIADHIPEFGNKGKEAATIRHVLTHTAGFRWVETGWPDAAWDDSIARICDARQERDWTPGKRAGYGPYASWFLLGEIVRRIDGRGFCEYVRQDLFEPLGMTDSWIAMPPERHRAYGDRIAIMQRRDGPAWVDYGMDGEKQCAACRPSGSGHGPARELGRFYEMLLNGGTRGGVRILSPQSVEALTARHRVGMTDETFRHVIDWGLGFLLNSNQYGAATVPYGYGRHASPRTFGHSGNQSSSAFADPEHGLAVACVCNGIPGEAAHQQRMREVHAAIYEDLGIGPGGAQGQ